MLTDGGRASASLCADDFAVGDRVETGELLVTAEMIRSFASKYDPQPMHLDEDAARASLFGELVGSGWQTLALTMRLIVDAHLLGSTPIVGGGFKEIRFHTPLRPGDVIRADAEVTGLRHSESRPDRGFLEWLVTTRNAADAILVTQNWTLMLPRKSY